MDILKKVQQLDAYNALITARASIIAAGPAGDLQVQDLVNRIDAVTNPYFN